MKVIKKRGVTGYVDTTGLFSKGHTIERWHRKIAIELRDATIAKAPVSSGLDRRPGREPGRLKRSIKAYGPTRGRPSMTEVYIRASAPHAKWVHGGTRTPIFPKRSRFLTVPPGAVAAGWVEHQLSGAAGQNPLRITQRKAWVLQPSKSTPLKSPGAKGFLLVKSVRGQDANPFMTDAMKIVAARHRWRPGRVRFPT